MSKTKPHTLAKAFHNYKPQSENEIELTKGDVLKVFEKFENGWWVGETSDGKLGVFPGSYVKEIPNESQQNTNTQAPPPQNTAVERPVQQQQKQQKQEETQPKQQEQPKNEPTTNKQTTANTDAKRKTGTNRKIIGQAEVLYDYEGKTDTELQLKKGSIVNILCKRQEDGWWQGEFEGRFGHFPAKYVREIPKKERVEALRETPKQRVSGVKPTVEKACGSTTANQSDNILENIIGVALYDYTGASEDELTFNKGDEIGILPAGSDAQWRKGVLNGKKANFPSKYIAEVNISSLSTDKKKMAIAIYKFQAVDASELNFQKGEIIEVLTEGAPDGWWKGINNGAQGHFPGNYVKILPTKLNFFSRFGINVSPASNDDDSSSSTTANNVPQKKQPENNQSNENNQEIPKKIEQEPESMKSSKESTSVIVNEPIVNNDRKERKKKDKKPSKVRDRQESIGDALEIYERFITYR